MFYLEYEKETGLVVKIHELEPTEINDGHFVAKSDSSSLGLGLELEFVISVISVDEKGFVTSLSTMKQVVPAYQLLKKIDELEKENKELKLAIVESAEAQQQDKLENQLAIAELAELIATKEVL